MLNLTKLTHDVMHGGEKGQIKSIADRYYKFVNIFDNVDSYGSPENYPYRLNIRTGGFSSEFILELENAGFSCKNGQTCNEWETSIRVKRDKAVQMHPPHMPMSVEIPQGLEVMAPTWAEFLEKVTYLGHLLGTLDNGIEVPKQAFGECETSIVLEVYKNVYGDTEYKNNQCDSCIQFELDFKGSIEAHNATGFERSLQQFVEHFKRQHQELYEKLLKDSQDESTNHKRSKRDFTRGSRSFTGRTRLPAGFGDYTPMDD